MFTEALRVSAVDHIAMRTLGLRKRPCHEARHTYKVPRKLRPTRKDIRQMKIDENTSALSVQHRKFVSVISAG